MILRKATKEDALAILDIIVQAQSYFKQNKIDQWQNGYPNMDSILNDIMHEYCYVICDNDKYDAVLFCNYLMPDTDSVSMDRIYNIYGIRKGADISSISVVDNRTGKKVIGPTLTDAKIICDFYASSLNLVDYNFSDYHEINYGHIKTEDELVKAYDKTADNKITIRIETNDGLRFYLEYDAGGGWIYSSGSMRYYKVTAEISQWFENHFNVNWCTIYDEPSFRNGARAVFILNGG